MGPRSRAVRRGSARAADAIASQRCGPDSRRDRQRAPGRPARGSERSSTRPAAATSRSRVKASQASTTSMAAARCADAGVARLRRRPHRRPVEPARPSRTASSSRSRTDAEPIRAAALEQRQQLALDAAPPVEQPAVARRSRSRAPGARPRCAPAHRPGRQAGARRRPARPPARRAAPGRCAGLARERMVGSRRDGSSATRMNMCRSVGSSSALSSAFWICSLARSACSTSTTRRSATGGGTRRVRAASGVRRRRCSRRSTVARASVSGEPITRSGCDPARCVATASTGVARARASRGRSRRRAPAGRRRIAPCPRPDGPWTSSVRPVRRARRARRARRRAVGCPRLRNPSDSALFDHAASIGCAVGSRWRPTHPAG